MARPVGQIVESTIPARLDALPWSRFHTLVIVAPGITWVLDGLEVTLAGAVSGALKASPSLLLSDTQVGLSPAHISRAPSSTGARKKPNVSPSQWNAPFAARVTASESLLRLRLRIRAHTVSFVDLIAVRDARDEPRCVRTRALSLR